VNGKRVVEEVLEVEDVVAHGAEQLEHGLHRQVPVGGHGEELW
jgi:hypothetical protein